MTFSGENGERFHPIVVRGMAVDPKSAQGFALAPGKGGTFEYPSTSPRRGRREGGSRRLRDERAEGRVHVPGEEHEIKNGLVAVAFVQDEATKKVLQATFVKIAPPPPAR